MIRYIFQGFITIQSLLILTACSSVSSQIEGEEKSVKIDSIIQIEKIQDSLFRTGIENLFDKDLLSGKSIAIVANQTSIVNGVHLVDTLLSLNQNLVKVFAPEHGFRGNHDAGANVKDDLDVKTGLKLLSLHGKSKKPSKDLLMDVDIMIFDIQDVGVRFYTYISTLHYVMEACAENNIPLLVLDRPNPNRHIIDGPILKEKYKSFVGVHPVPVCYGMTIGEYGRMINGEYWLKDSIQCELQVIEMSNYNNLSTIELAIAPSPNLPNNQSILLYPSLCFFEGTDVSIGRGTDFPFQVFGKPEFNLNSFQFTPESRPGFSKHPKYEGKVCKGLDLREFDTMDLSGINWYWLVEAYQNSLNKDSFFLKNKFIRLLAGTEQLELWIKKGLSNDEIRKKYESELDQFRLIRSKYLIYE